MDKQGRRAVATGKGMAMDTEAVRQRHGMGGELLLAVPPTLVVLGAVFAVELLRHERVLYASLASSAFLVYRDPGHRMNTIRVMVTAHVVTDASQGGGPTAAGATADERAAAQAAIPAR